MATDYLADNGRTLLLNGWNIVPTRVGSKVPPMSGWGTVESSLDSYARWLKAYPGAGISVRTRNTPAVDIDVRDADLAGEIQDYVIALVGEAPIRVGQMPKRLLVYSTNTPFRKRMTKNGLRRMETTIKWRSSATASSSWPTTSIRTPSSPTNG
ncbi:MAG: bifunctional DNA primase/polymerase [Janthinobacterium lividum]